MYKETRKVQVNSCVDSVSTPEMWAQNFASSTKINLYRRLLFIIDKRWALIKRYIKKDPILDAGCGFGEWVAYLAGKGRTAEGLDYSESLIQRLLQTYPNYSWHLGDIEDIPLPNESFAGVISWGVIEHKDHGPLKALKEFWRILIPMGVIIVTVPIDSKRMRLSSQAQFPASEVKGGNTSFFQYFMTEAELKQFMENAGFAVIESGVTGGASLALFSPFLHQRCPSSAKIGKLLNRFVWLCFSWKKSYSVMIYCVAQKVID